MTTPSVLEYPITLCLPTDDKTKSQPIIFKTEQTLKMFVEEHPDACEYLKDTAHKRPYFHITKTLGNKPTLQEMAAHCKEPWACLVKYIKSRFPDGGGIKHYAGYILTENSDNTYQFTIEFILCGTQVDDYMLLKKYIPHPDFSKDIYRKNYKKKIFKPLNPTSAFLDRFTQAQTDSLRWIVNDKKKKVDDGSVIIDDDNEGADILLERFSGVLRKCKKRVFIFHENVWAEDYEDALRSMILVSNLKKIPKDTAKPYSANVSGANALMKAIISKLENSPSFVDELWNANLLKIFYKNGYYDFKVGRFIPSLAFEDSPTLFRIPFDFPEQSDENEQLVLDNVLMPIFNDKEVLDNYLALIARGLAGCVEDKQWFIIRGFRNSGKGVMNDAQKSSFPPYVSTFSADTLLINKHSATQDVAKTLSSFAKWEWLRLCASHEMTMDGRQINGNMIKGKLASGGDVIELRTLYTNEKDVKFQALAGFNLNDAPSFNSPDCLETLFQFKFSSIFSDDPQGDMKLADPNLKKKLLTNEYISGFTHLVLKAFTNTKVKRCALVQEWTDSLKENNDDEEIKIKDAFTFTDGKNPKDFILNSDLKSWWEMQKLNMSFDKLGDYLIKLGAKYDKNIGLLGARGNQRGFRRIKTT